MTGNVVAAVVTFTAGEAMPRLPETFVCMLALPLLLTGVSARARAQSLTYPAAKRGGVVDDYHGTKVADPYRWLEDVDAPDTRAWIEAENQLSSAYLAAIPQRAAIERRLTAVWNYA